MERRRAVAIAAATATTTLAAVAAIGANFGLLGFGQARSSPAGNLEAGRVAQVAEPPPAPSAPGAGPGVTVRYEDIYLPTPAAAPGAPASANPPPEPTAAVQPTEDHSMRPVDSNPVAGDDSAPPGAEPDAEYSDDEHTDRNEHADRDDDHDEEEDD